MCYAHLLLLPLARTVIKRHTSNINYSNPWIISTSWSFFSADKDQKGRSKDVGLPLGQSSGNYSLTWKIDQPIKSVLGMRLYMERQHFLHVSLEIKRENPTKKHRFVNNAQKYISQPLYYNCSCTLYFQIQITFSPTVSKYSSIV